MVLDRYEEQLKQVIAWHEREALSTVRMLRQTDKEELDAHG